MLHVPILRGGDAYESIAKTELRHVKTGRPMAAVSQANSGLISKDLNAVAAGRRALASLSHAELIDICGRAADLFAGGELPVDPASGTTQSADEYVNILSATTGMPHTLCRANMEKIRYVLAEMSTVLGGLTRGLDLSVLDTGWTRQDGRDVSYIAEADVLGVILPSNSPGVHSLWLPSIPLKTPLALKPGSREPWSPMRIVQALIAAGCPRQALGFYPADYSGATQILMRCGRSMLFGDESTVRGWRQDTRVQIHGTGWSKVLLGEDLVDGWQDHLDLMVTSVAENGGRSCLNASGVRVPRHGREIADALARRLASIEARPLDDPEARLAAFSDPEVAKRISEFIDRQLAIPGAEDVTAAHRSTGRLVECDGCTFVLPTLIWCEDPAHPLAATELLLPFASVVETPQDEMLNTIGPTLVATALTEDEAFKREVMAARDIDRLNLGAIPTSRVSWDQPHEGNLFEHLYRQRALQARAIA